jgi:hypothetical protein
MDFVFLLLIAYLSPLDNIITYFYLIYFAHDLGPYTEEEMECEDDYINTIFTQIKYFKLLIPLFNLKISPHIKMYDGMFGKNLILLRDNRNIFEDISSNYL